MPFIGAQKRSNEASAEKRCLDWRYTFGRLVGNLLIAHLDDLCVYHYWLFVLIRIIPTREETRLQKCSRGKRI